MTTRYATPRTVDDAAGILAEGGVTVFAGATDIYPTAVGRAIEGDVLDLTKVESLRGIEKNGSSWRIGACTTWSDVISASLPQQFHALQAASRQIGGIQIQNRGTVGGNLCTASPAGDSIPVLLSLSASVEIASHRGRRTLPLNEFIVGYRKTSLAPDEFVVAVHFPERAGPSDFQKLGSRSHLVISIAMVASHLDVTSESPKFRIAVGACSPVAVRLEGLEAELERNHDFNVKSYDFSELSPIGDVRSSAEYRHEVVGALVARSVVNCQDLM